MRIGEWQQEADKLNDKSAKEFSDAIKTLLKWPTFESNYKELDGLKSILKFQKHGPKGELFRQRF